MLSAVAEAIIAAASVSLAIGKLDNIWAARASIEAKSCPNCCSAQDLTINQAAAARFDGVNGASVD